MVQKRKFHKSQTLQDKFHDLIPGGSHTYAKGDDQYPEFLAPYITKGKGCRVWDIDDNEFIEYGMGLRAVSLGHGYKPVVEAAYRQMQLGTNYSRPAKIELDAAEAFLDLVPGAEMVKFAKNGSDCTTAAVKLARAVTGKDMIAICGDHPFFSVDDWFIGKTVVNAGIPKSIQDLTLTFKYNDIKSVQTLFHRYPGKIACFILEPEKYEPLNLKFVTALQALCKKYDALLILDEMITGFRWHIGGAQTLYNIQPDLSTFGKAMGNGFAIAALAGKKEYMELGGLLHDKERVFLLSTTHGAENHALAAAMAVMKTYREEQVIEQLQCKGERLRKGLLQSIKDNNLEGHVGIHGHPSCLVFSTNDQDKNPSQSFRTLFMQECLKQGLLAPNLVISFSHSDKDVDQTLDIIHYALKVYRKGLDEGVDKYLEGRSVQPVYRKWNHEHHNKT